MPFPIDECAIGFENMFADEQKSGELNYKVSSINSARAQDFVAQAYQEPLGRQELQKEYWRVGAIAQKWEY